MQEAKSYGREVTDSNKNGGIRTALASFAAIGSVLAASSCCLPILPFMMAAGFAGGSAFLSAARPYMLLASVVFIGCGFYQGRRAKSVCAPNCSCQLSSTVAVRGARVRLHILP
jgi:hypothetical protein